MSATPVSATSGWSFDDMEPSWAVLDQREVMMGIFWLFHSLNKNILMSMDRKRSLQLVVVGGMR